MAIESSSAVNPPEKNELFGTLVTQKQRQVLDLLLITGEPKAMADIAIELARQQEFADEAVWQEASRIRIELYHRHLPKLADIGLVEIDTTRNTVSLTSAGAEVRDRLSLG